MKKKILRIEIETSSCNENRCADNISEGKMCKYLGSTKFGLIPVCMLFPSDENAYTELKQGDDNCTLRCEDCMGCSKL
jgi:hypothetical protein